MFAKTSSSSSDVASEKCRSLDASMSDYYNKKFGPPLFVRERPSRLMFGVEEYNPLWPSYFKKIKSDLASDLADEGVSYLAIEHIGSTAVPGLLSKSIVVVDPCSDLIPQLLFKPQAMIDVCIIIAPEDFNDDKLKQIDDALGWGRRQGGYRYIGDGGVQDRWSFKLEGVTPLRSVYVVAEGSIPLRAYRSLRDTLRVDAELRDEYARVKVELVKNYYNHIMDYCKRKRPTIRKIFIKAGWTHEEVDEAERQATREVAEQYVEL